MNFLISGLKGKGIEFALSFVWCQSSTISESAYFGSWCDATHPSGDPGIGAAPRAAVRAGGACVVRACAASSLPPSFLARDRLQLVISENPLSFPGGEGEAEDDGVKVQRPFSGPLLSTEGRKTARKGVSPSVSVSVSQSPGLCGLGKTSLPPSSLADLTVSLRRRRRRRLYKRGQRSISSPSFIHSPLSF